MKKIIFHLSFFSICLYSSSQINCNPNNSLVQPLYLTNNIGEKVSVEYACNSKQKTEQENFKSIFQTQSEEYSKYNFTTEEQWDSLYKSHNPNASINKKKSTQGSCPLNKIVFGWNPYWISSTQYNNYDYSLLSDLSYFSYEINSNTGGYNTIYNWLTSGAVTNAQNAGCRVNLCATLFSGHTTFLNNPTSVQNFITTIISLVQQRNANGVNIDFEGMTSSNSVAFTNFMISLCNQMHAAIPGSQISIALPAVDWSNIFDVGTMNTYVDLFIIMGYDYHWKNSANAGPVSPLNHGNYWPTIDCSKSVVYYLNDGVSPNKLCLGVPYYGYDWPTSSNAINATTTASGTAVVYYNAYPNSQTYGYQWNIPSSTPYYMYNSGGWHQTWYDDENSLAAKYDMVNFLDIAGIGIWALGYDDGYTACWTAIQDKFTTCAPPQQCTGTFNDLGGPGNYYDNEDWVYTIAPPNSSQVSIAFSSFSVENNYDFLYVYDGPNTLSPLIGTYTGTTSPGTITSSGNALTFRFTSDINTVAQGWNATWNCVQNNLPANLTAVPNICPQIGVTLNWTNSGTGWYCDVSDDPNFSYFWNKDVTSLTSVNCPGGFCDYPSCTSYLKFEPNTTYYWRIWNGSTQTNGGSFTTPVCSTTDINCSGNIYDSGGPSSAYSGNEDYIYAISPTNASSVTINFSSFDLETNFDSLYIYDGNSINAPLLGSYTGIISPGTISSTTGDLTLHFISDPFVNNLGFAATWTCTQVSTGIIGESKIYNYSVYPNPFSNYTTINYSLNTENRIEIKLVDVLGREIFILDENKKVGTYTIQINKNELQLTSGIYFLKIAIDDQNVSLKLVVD